MKKPGCSNISIMLKLIGASPFVAGLIAFYMVYVDLDAGLNTSWFVGLLVCWFVGLLVCWFVQGIMLTLFGALTWGYRAFLYFDKEKISINKRHLFVWQSIKTIYYSHFLDIFVDMRTATPAIGGSTEPYILRDFSRYVQGV